MKTTTIFSVLAVVLIGIVAVQPVLGDVTVSVDNQYLRSDSDYGGGGRVTLTVEGGDALDLREKIFEMYDSPSTPGGVVGILDKGELYPGAGSATSAQIGYLSAVEYYIETNDYGWGSIGGVKPVHGDEGGDSWTKDVDGLLDVPVTPTDPIIIRLLYDSSRRVSENITFGDMGLHEALYAPFSNGSFDAGDVNNFITTDLTYSNSYWHRTSDGTLVHNGTFSWWCGKEVNRNYPGDLTDAMDASVNLTSAVSPQLGFWTRILLGAGTDRGLLQINDGLGWTTLDVYDTNITGAAPDIYQYREYDLAAYAGSSVTIRFLFETDSAGTSLGWFIDDIKIFEDQNPNPIIWSEDAEGTVYGITWGDVVHAEDFWRHDGSAWICNDLTTGQYVANMDNELEVIPYLDWRFVDGMTISFEHSGSIGMADFLVVEVSTSPAYIQNKVWTSVNKITSTTSSWETVVLDSEIEQFLGEEHVRLRFRFMSDSAGVAEGVSIRNINLESSVMPDTDYIFQYEEFCMGGYFYSNFTGEGTFTSTNTVDGVHMTYDIVLTKDSLIIDTLILTTDYIPPEETEETGAGEVLQDNYLLIGIIVLAMVGGVVLLVRYKKK